MTRATFLPILLTLSLAACDKPTTSGPTGEGQGATIPCALAGTRPFTPVCTVERSAAADGIVLTIHHPDGGFRRLRVATDGRGVVTADGADTATVKVAGSDAIEVGVGDDRYRLPATVKGQAGPAQ